MSHSLRFIPLVLALTGCAGAHPMEATHKPPKPPVETQSTEQANLLLFPQTDAESLLGRAVHATGDGGWTIADARAPGCEVQIKRKKAEFGTHRQVNIHDLTSISAGFAKIVDLEAKYGKAVTADIAIENTEILQADTRGPCGETIVETVFVGRGKRTLMVSSEVAGKLGVAINGIVPSVEHDGSSKVLDETEWKTEQAYGFAPKRIGNQPPLDVTVRMAATIQEGDTLDIVIESGRKAYVVAYFLEVDGKAEVLLPTSEEPEVVAEPGKPATIPTARERAAGVKLQAALRKPRHETRETLMVYAFAEKGDFDRLKPAAGDSDAQGAAYAAQLTDKLQDVPISRWARVLTGYTIVPKKPR